MFIEISKVEKHSKDTSPLSIQICQIDLHLVHLVIKNNIVHHIRHPATTVPKATTNEINQSAPTAATEPMEEVSEFLSSQF
jgi:hypothetical protein